MHLILDKRNFPKCIAVRAAGQSPKLALLIENVPFIGIRFKLHSLRSRSIDEGYSRVRRRERARQRAALLTIGMAAALAAAAIAPRPHSPSRRTARLTYWPHRTFNIPVNVERINQSENKPTHLQLYSSINRGQWQAGAKLPITDLQNLGDGKKGFKFTADRDGEFEFSVQYWYGSENSPRGSDELRADARGRHRHHAAGRSDCRQRQRRAAGRPPTTTWTPAPSSSKRSCRTGPNGKRSRGATSRPPIRTRGN